MSPPPAPSRTPIRRRRFLLFAALLIGCMFFFGVPWELPPSLKDAGILAISRASIAKLAKSKTNASAPKPDVDEIYGLLHLVTGDAEHEHILSQVANLDPTKPVDMSVYAAGNKKFDWNGEMEKLNTRYPVVVFSKSYCQFSNRAKKLLQTYNLHPPPKVVEVDLRDDSDIIKAILTRLTKQATFPNTLLRGRSIGGSDDLQALHAQRVLSKVLEQAGAAVRDDGSGK